MISIDRIDSAVNDAFKNVPPMNECSETFNNIEICNEPVVNQNMSSTKRAITSPQVYFAA